MKSKYTEEVIEKMINYLKIKHPQRATRERAIAVLDEMKVASKDITEALGKLTKSVKKPLN